MSEMGVLCKLGLHEWDEGGPFYGPRGGKRLCLLCGRYEVARVVGGRWCYVTVERAVAIDTAREEAWRKLLDDQNREMNT